MRQTFGLSPFLLSLVCLCVLTPAIGSEKAIVEAPAGQFRAYVLGAESADVEFEGTMQLKSFNDDPRWPPAVYFGFQVGPDRARSIQIVMIRNHEDGKHLAIGYRLILNGEEAKAALISTVETDHLLKARLTFHHGIATFYIDEEAPIAIPTTFTSVTPYLSVSSASGEFDITSAPK